MCAGTTTRRSVLPGRTELYTFARYATSTGAAQKAKAKKAVCLHWYALISVLSWLDLIGGWLLDVPYI